jgi:carbon monoxide dehydrogenase subunit G
MSIITIHCSIDAPKEVVFRTISDIRNFAEAVPDIVDVSFISDSKTGVGTRFKETRLIGGREHTEELEVTEYDENNSIRLVTDSNGTVWDSLFTVSDDHGATKLTLVMEAKAYKFMAKIMNPLMKYFINKAVGKDMDAVKAYCER